MPIYPVTLTKAHWSNWRLLLACALSFITILPAAAHAELTILGEPCLSLKEVARNTGLSLKIMAPQEAIFLEDKIIKLQFHVNKRNCKVQGVTVVLGFPATLHAAEVYISKRDYEGVLLPILLPQRFRMPRAGKLQRIVLDPGHGGKDQGAQNKALCLIEKNLTLDLSQRLAHVLTTQGYEVILTRTQDVFVSLNNRTIFCNNHKADLFISIHFNTAAATQAQGIETYALTACMQPSSGRSKLEAQDRERFPGNQWDSWNVIFGFYMQQALTRELKTHDRGLKRARFVVLKNLACPGILIECGFLTNPQEAKKIQDPAYLQKIAGAIAQGIENYHQTLNHLLKK